jgi:hypothetical protein
MRLRGYPSGCVVFFVVSSGLDMFGKKEAEQVAK